MYWSKTLNRYIYSHFLLHALIKRAAMLANLCWNICWIIPGQRWVEQSAAQERVESSWSPYPCTSYCRTQRSHIETKEFNFFSNWLIFFLVNNVQNLTDLIWKFVKIKKVYFFASEWVNTVALNYVKKYVQKISWHCAYKTLKCLVHDISKTYFNLVFS